VFPRTSKLKVSVVRECKQREDFALSRFIRNFCCSRFCDGRASKLHHVSIEFNKLQATSATATTWIHQFPFRFHQGSKSGSGPGGRPKSVVESEAIRELGCSESSCRETPKPRICHGSAGLQYPSRKSTSPFPARQRRTRKFSRRFRKR
jgi:hypothetical protein